MNQDIVLLEIVLDVTVSIFQMRVNVLVFHVFQIDPFVVLYLVSVHFVLNFVVIESPLVNYGENTIDTEVIFERIFQGINTRQI